MVVHKNEIIVQIWQYRCWAIYRKRLWVTERQIFHWKDWQIWSSWCSMLPQRGGRSFRCDLPYCCLTKVKLHLLLQNVSQAYSWPPHTLSQIEKLKPNYRFI